MTPRSFDRDASTLRPLTIELGVMKFAEGSALITLGDTKVLTTASVERRVPKFLEETPRGWLTAEYSMLPRATQTRSQREVTRGRPSGRSAEIQRLIGRSLRDLQLQTRYGLTVMAVDQHQEDGGVRRCGARADLVLGEGDTLVVVGTQPAVTALQQGAPPPDEVVA